MMSSPPRPPPPPPPPSAKPKATPAAARRKVWVKDSTSTWVIGEVAQEIANAIEVALPSGSVVTVPQKDICDVNPAATDDMTALRYLHEPGILVNLQERYAERKIYTYMASALLAVNPFTAIPHPSMSDYITGNGANNPPHPYAIAENCYRNLLVLRKNQSVVISGESGAGKTETAKIIVKYLAERNRAVASTTTNAPKRRTSISGDELYHKLNRVSPILESFGNAKTTRNHNSSRFGKFMKLNFAFNEQTSKKQSKSMQLTGAMIETYLLEKSRVVFQSDQERNFHIFYALLQTPPQQLTASVNMKSQAFRIAKSHSNMTLEESHTLQSVTEALRTIGIADSVISEIWQILTALLFLCEVSFIEKETGEGPVAAIQNDAHVQTTAKLLGVDADTVRYLVTQREVTARGEKFNVPLTLREAGFTRDATAKAIYEAVFNYIVKYINASLTGVEGEKTGDEDEKTFIGVLDIFGFESFEKNGFEQLLINYANEALQNTFNKQIFEKEIALFEEQKIDFHIGVCPNNKLCVDLISMRGDSVFGTLDSISRQPQPSDERFCEELHKAFTRKNKHFGTVHRKDMRNVFVIAHYASEVKYMVSSSKDNADDSWIVKNNDSTPDLLENVYATSAVSVLKSFATFVPATAASSGKAPMKRKMSVMMKPTIVTIFTKSMDELNYLLESTICHFIRCIKPNFAQVAMQFDAPFVLEQIHALGVLQACEVLSVSLPTRVAYADLKGALTTTVAKVQHLFPDDNDVLLISSILKAYGFDTEKYRLGTSIAFFKPGQLATLETILNSDVSEADQNRIVQSITLAVERYKEVMKDMGTVGAQLQHSVSLVAQLEQRHERVRDEFAEFPEVQGLDIPDKLVQFIGQIEKQIARLKGKYDDCQKGGMKADSDLASKGWKKGEHAIVDASVFSAVEKNKLLLHGIEKIFTNASSMYAVLHKKIETLEEQNNKGEGKALRDLVEKGDNLYETIMDLVSQAEESLGLVRINAERGAVDQAQEAYGRLNKQLGEINGKCKVLKDGIEECDRLISTLKSKSNTMDVDFSEVESQAQSIIALINQGLQKATESTDLSTHLVKQLIPDAVEDLHREEKAKAQRDNKQKHDGERALASAAAAMVAARHATQANTPHEDSHAEADGSKDSKTSAVSAMNDAMAKRRGSVAFNIKDLKALKEKKGGDDAGATNSTNSATISSSDTAGRGSAGTSGSGGAEESKVYYTSTGEALPAGWRELTDPKSNRPYYVNKDLKLRQWAKPTAATPTSVARPMPATPAATPAIASSEASSGGSDDLPAGWRACLDKKTGRTYYVNDETKARQWRKPEGANRRGSVRGGGAAGGGGVEVVAEGRKRKSVSMQGWDMSALKSETDAAGGRGEDEDRGGKGKASSLASVFNATGQTRSTAEKIEEYRKRAATIMSEELTYDEELDEAMKQTVSYLARLGSQSKVGYLSKQSKLLGRWRKRYFCLTEDTLCYFESEKEFDTALANNRGSLKDITKFVKPEKVFKLTGSCITYFTNTEHCFSLSVYSSTQGSMLEDEMEPWYLLSDTDAEMDDWMKAINGHIHMKYMTSQKIHTDYWDEGGEGCVGLTLWKVPGATGGTGTRRPVGIRTVPRVDGPRTGEGLFPGEVVEVVQVLDDRTEGQRYLRLADDRGWIFENHPMLMRADPDRSATLQAKYAIVLPAGGTVIEMPCTFSYPAHFLEPLTIYTSPTCSKDSATNMTIKPGDLVYGSCIWTVPACILNGDVEDDLVCMYVRLNDGRGWVERVHSVTGGELLVPV